MSFGEIFSKNSGTRVVFKTTLVAVFAIIIYAVNHYRTLNRSEDPAVAEARQIMAEFEKMGSDFDLAYKFRLLDSADSIYSSLKGYEDSYERGVILNNRCGALLFSALYDSTLTPDITSAYLSQALEYADSSISYYNRWVNNWGCLAKEDIRNKVIETTDRLNPLYREYNIEKIIEKRSENITEAISVSDRRLSVSYSNMGIAYRHTMVPDSAIACFKKALELWDKNRIAQSNLSVLMGGKPVTPGLIESLFPPKR